MEDRLKLYSQREVQELYKLGRRIFGAPVPMFHPRSKTIPPEDALRGLIAENVVASTLNLLTLDKAGLYVFHSVGVDEEDGETDHVLIYKNHLYLIETKNRSNLEKVFINKEGMAYALRKGQRIKLHNNNLAEKVSFYKEKYPHMNVEGIMVVHHETRNTGSDYEGCSVVSLTNFLESVCQKIEQAEDGKVDVWLMVKNFANLCIRNELVY